MISNPFRYIESRNARELCKDIFTAKFVIDNNDEDKDDISTRIKTKIINAVNAVNDNSLLRLITGFIKYHTSCRRQKQVFLCFSSAEIRLYITDDPTTVSRFFALYDESNIENIKILGLVEPNSNLHSIDNRLNNFYYGQRRRVGK